ncbi:SpoIIIAH-like family protein [Bacillus sp. V3B]|uniref:SpoIIIAH-like family protein n=1 Tax=Bacillus sp. V3B TaxID=2804915 RepID=UPI002108CF5C|nr:SpoIIIAH-like family protein [Bacillus sp. V3B]MCQ6273744.1 SpoIIIAH-like family protein [Bacillus sp. V3B]
MLLKKQTVWLLTMLSLVVVLSVYYLTSPEQQQNELAGVEEKEETEQMEENTVEDLVSNGADEDAQIITNAAGDEAFETLRMQLEDERSQKKEDLTKTIGSTELPVEERSEAKEQMDELNEIAQKEALLETLIKAMNYEDVLVRADGEQVNITVKAEKQSTAEANKIIQTVRSEVGPLHAVVEFQMAK